MFFSDPGFDLRVSLGLLVFSAIVGLVVLAKTRNKFKAFVIFSVLGNLSFLANIGSRMFIAYNIKWLGYFALIFWPILNIYLLIKYFSKK